MSLLFLLHKLSVEMWMCRRTELNSHNNSVQKPYQYFKSFPAKIIRYPLKLHNSKPAQAFPVQYSIGKYLFCTCICIPYTVHCTDSLFYFTWTLIQAMNSLSVKSMKNPLTVSHQILPKGLKYSRSFWTAVERFQERLYWILQNFYKYFPKKSLCLLINSMFAYAWVFCKVPCVHLGKAS